MTISPFGPPVVVLKPEQTRRLLDGSTQSAPAFGIAFPACPPTVAVGALQAVPLHFLKVSVPLPA